MFICESEGKHTHTHTQGSAKYLPQLAWNHVVIEHRSAGKVYTTTDAVSVTYARWRFHVTCTCIYHTYGLTIMDVFLICSVYILRYWRL